MDHVDWLDAKTVQEVANTLAQQVLPGGIVIWRSASLSPPYSKVRLRHSAGTVFPIEANLAQTYPQHCVGSCCTIGFPHVDLVDGGPLASQLAAGHLTRHGSLAHYLHKCFAPAFSAYCPEHT
jgi:hypothetical protein